MNLKPTVVLVAALTGGASFASEPEAASLAEQVLGSWELVSLTVLKGEKRIELFGPNPRGIQMMGDDGRFANIITRESLPLYAGADRMSGTPEEYRAILQGSNAMFGTYTVDEESGEVIFDIDVSTYPNWDGATQRKRSTVSDDVWRYVNATTTIGEGEVEVVWKRFE